MATDKILDLFTRHHSLRFSQIEKKMGMRSNKLAYHLKKLVDKGVLSKDEDCYSLSENYESIVPYLSERNAVFSVLLVHIGDKHLAYLHKREKRPFKGRLSLPGGRMLVGESIEEGVRRIMKEKHGIDAKLGRINSISLEHVKKGKKIVYSFLLIFVHAAATDELELTALEKNKTKIISSDYKLIKNDGDKEVTIETLITRKY